MTQNPTQNKVEGLVKKVLSIDADNFADKFSPVKQIAESLDNEGRRIFLDVVDAMYETNPYAALGFTLYAQLSELEDKVKEQIIKGTPARKEIAIQIAGDLNLKQLYESIECAADSFNGAALISLYKLDVDRTIPKIKDYLNLADENEIEFVLRNLICYHIQKRDEISIEKLRKLAKEIKKDRIFESVYMASSEKK